MGPFVLKNVLEVAQMHSTSCFGNYITHASVAEAWLNLNMGNVSTLRFPVHPDRCFEDIKLWEESCNGY